MENGTIYFVPSLVGGGLAFSKETSPGLGPETILKTADGFIVRGSFFLEPARDIPALLEAAGLTPCGLSTADGIPVVIVSRKPVADDIVITHHKTDDEQPQSERYPVLLNSARDALARFAAYTGLNPRIHFRATPVCEPFTEGDEHTLHIVVGASPPGAAGNVDRQMLCGVRLHPEGLYRFVNGPTPGRGFMIEDEYGQSCAQMLDQNVFLFTPQITLQTSVLFSSEGGDLLLKLLQLVSKALAEQKKAEEEIPLDSADAYGAYALKIVGDDRRNLTALVDEADTEIERARNAYRRALNARRHYLASIEVGDRLLQEMLHGTAANDWQRLTSHPLIERLFALDSGLHVQTKRIIALHEGYQYDFGPFMLRARLRGRISAWALTPTHPRKLHHPHISERSSLCFGNAGLHIEEALESFRLADAIELVLEWLVSGYDPTLASVKIEEWPQYKEAA